MTDEPKKCPKCGAEMQLLEMHSAPGIWYLWECQSRKCGHEEKVR